MLTDTKNDVETSAHCSLVKANYHVHFEADPNLISRLLAPFAKLSLIPDRIFSDREAHAEQAMNLEVRLFSVDVAKAKRVENTLRAVIGVKRVILVMENLD